MLVIMHCSAKQAPNIQSKALRAHQNVLDGERLLEIAGEGRPKDKVDLPPVCGTRGTSLAPQTGDRWPQDKEQKAGCWLQNKPHHLK
jgi:hypothetical protein